MREKLIPSPQTVTLLSDISKSIVINHKEFTLSPTGKESLLMSMIDHYCEGINSSVTQQEIELSLLIVSFLKRILVQNNVNGIEVKIREVSYRNEEPLSENMTHVTPVVVLSFGNVHYELTSILNLEDRYGYMKDGLSVITMVTYEQRFPSSTYTVDNYCDKEFSKVAYEVAYGIYEQHLPALLTWGR